MTDTAYKRIQSTRIELLFSDRINILIYRNTKMFLHKIRINVALNVSVPAHAAGWMLSDEKFGLAVYIWMKYDIDRIMRNIAERIRKRRTPLRCAGAKGIKKGAYLFVMHIFAEVFSLAVKDTQKIKNISALRTDEIGGLIGNFFAHVFRQSA